MSSGATNSFSRRTHFRVLGGSAHVMHIDCYCDRVQLDRTEKFRNLIARYRDILTLRRLTSYIYMEHPFLMFLDHTRRRSTVGRTPLDE